MKSAFLSNSVSLEKNAAPKNAVTPLPFGISKTFVINIDSRRDRLRYLSERLYNLSIPYERFSAINFHHGHYPIADYVVANHLHPETKMNLTRARQFFRGSSDKFNNWGSAGCWQSHLQLFFHISNVSAHFMPGPFLILEDDIDFGDNAMPYLTPEFLDTILPSNWELFFLSHLYMRCHSTIKKQHSANLTTLDDLCHISKVYTSAAYIVRNHTVVTKMINLLNTENVTVIDHIWIPPFLNQELVGYAPKRSVIRQRPTQSNIFRDNKVSNKKPLIGVTASHTFILP